MNKKFYFILIILTAFILTACASKEDMQYPTVLQDFIGATNEQTKSIEKILARYNITYETVAISTNPLMAGMDEHWQAYDLTDENGKVYILILRKEDFDFTAVLENDGTLIEGLIDNGVTPLLFTDRID